MLIAYNVDFLCFIMQCKISIYSPLHFCFYLIFCILSKCSVTIEEIYFHTLFSVFMKSGVLEIKIVFKNSQYLNCDSLVPILFTVKIIKNDIFFSQNISNNSGLAFIKNLS